MAACEEPVSLLIGTEGAGLYNCITADLEVSPPPPQVVFLQRAALQRITRGPLSCFLSPLSCYFNLAL